LVTIKTVEPSTLGVLVPAGGFDFGAAGFRFAAVFFGFCEAAQDTRERITIRVNVMDFMLSNSLPDQICTHFKLDPNSGGRLFEFRVQASACSFRRMNMRTKLKLEL
jgi:hypothetical protein